MSKKIFIFMLAIIFMLSGSAWAVSKRVADVYKAAEKEGELLWVSTLKETEARPITKAFNKTHPKIKASYIRQHGGQAMERLLREVQSGVVPYDAVLIHPDYLTEFMKLNVIQQVNWADFGVPPEFILNDNRFVAAFEAPFVIVYNKNLVKPEDSPKNWEDLLDPKWKGRVVVDTRPSGFLRLTGAWGPEKTLDYLRKLRKNKPIFFRGQTKAATLMAAGDFEVAACMYLHSYVHVAEKKGGPLAFNVPDPIPTNRYKFGVLKQGIKNPNAGKVFLAWLAKEGGKMMEQINWGRAMPFKGSKKEKLYAGKKLGYPPPPEMVPDRHQYTLEMLKALGVSKSKRKKKK